MTITLRLVKGSELTHAELDGNFTDLDSRVKSGGAAALSVIAASGAADTLNASNFGVVDLTLTANCALTLTGVAIANTAFKLTLVVRQDATGNRTLAWPTSLRWPSSGAPTLTSTSGRIDIFELMTTDGGTIWFGRVLGQGFSTAATLGLDTFTRADSTTVMGSAETGGAWSPLAGVWGITGNRAYKASNDGDCQNVLNVGVTDVDVTCDIVVPASGAVAPGIVLRAVDTSNLIQVTIDLLFGGIIIHHKVAGAFTQLGPVLSVLPFPVSGTTQTLRAKIIGQQLWIYLNGTLVHNATYTGITLTGTRVGIRDGNAVSFGCRFDNFNCVQAA